MPAYSHMATKCCTMATAPQRRCRQAEPSGCRRSFIIESRTAPGGMAPRKHGRAMVHRFATTPGVLGGRTCRRVAPLHRSRCRREHKSGCDRAQGPHIVTDDRSHSGSRVHSMTQRTATSRLRLITGDLLPRCRTCPTKSTNKEECVGDSCHRFNRYRYWLLVVPAFACGVRVPIDTPVRSPPTQVDQDADTHQAPTTRRK